MMASRLAALGFLVLVSLSAFAAPLEWRDATRDVYVDGKLERRAQVLSALNPRRVAVFSDNLRHALVIDVDRGVSYTAPKREWVFTRDRMKASTANDLSAKGARPATKTADNVLIAHVGRKSLVIKPHQSKAGSIEVADLLASFPVWNAAMQAYEPDAQAVQKLASVREPVTIRAVFATWCGDSKLHVPQLLKTVRAANNTNVRVELMGIGPEFETPLDFVQSNRILNVPTFIVEREGVELGRYAETPATKSVEQDLAAIVERSLPPHPGRIERKALVASGRYDISDSLGAAREEWEIHTTPSGGRLVHSVITRGSDIREIWHTFDAEGKTKFVEITDGKPQHLRRTRYSRGEATITAHSRGSMSGIIDQVVSIPATCDFDSTAIVTAAAECRGDDDRVITAYRVSSLDPAGRLEPVEIRVAGDGRYEKVAAGQLEQIWIDESLGIPKRVESSDGTVATLAYLHLE